MTIHIEDFDRDSITFGIEGDEALYQISVPDWYQSIHEEYDYGHTSRGCYSASCALDWDSVHQSHAEEFAYDNEHLKTRIDE